MQELDCPWCHPKALGYHSIFFLGMFWSVLPYHSSLLPALPLCCGACCSLSSQAGSTAVLNALSFFSTIFLRLRALWQASWQNLHSSLSPGTFSR